MTAWVIRGGKYAEREDEALENGFLTIGFGIIKSLDNVQTPDEVAGCLDLSGNETNQQLASRVSQVWAFKDGIKTGDTVVMPRKGPSLLAVGRITGEYTYRPEHQDFSHARAVEWINQAVPRSRLPQDLQGPMNGLRTIYRPSPVDAEEQLLAAANGDPEGVIKTPEPREWTPVSQPETPPVNLNAEAQDRIRAHIEKNFHGHEFTRLVAEVLRAQGYGIEVAPPGPDGGVDIVAGTGPMGFNPPRICVQVKSGGTQTNVNTVRELEGVIKNFGADYGLFVSWSGFTPPAKNEARKSAYFNVRLWDSEAFLNSLFEQYDRLPASLRAELPIRQIWILDEPDA